MALAITTVVTLALAGLLGRVVWLASRARSWPTVDGEITRSDLEIDEGAHLRVTYRYAVGPHTHTSERVRFGGLASALTKRGARALAARYPRGARVPVRVDPSNPRRAVVELGVGSPVWAGFVVCALIEVVAIVDHLRG